MRKLENTRLNYLSINQECCADVSDYYDSGESHYESDSDSEGDSRNNESFEDSTSSSSSEDFDMFENEETPPDDDFILY